MMNTLYGPRRSVSPPAGFTLVELLITIAIVAVLLTLAYPSFSNYIQKARRSEAQTLLVNWANNQEIWRANNPVYAGTDDIAAPLNDWYTFSVSGVSANGFVLTATAKSGSSQASDKQKGTPCTPLTLNQSGNKSPGDCW
jgi:type IV pilus assembly protein PilE